MSAKPLITGALLPVLITETSEASVTVKSATEGALDAVTTIFVAPLPLIFNAVLSISVAVRVFVSGSYLTFPPSERMSSLFSEVTVIPLTVTP